MYFEYYKYKEFIAHLHSVEKQLGGIERMIIEKRHASDICIQCLAVAGSIDSLVHIHFKNAIHADFCHTMTTPLFFTITDRKSTRLNSSHGYISYAVFCL